jgi:lipoate-protein ligase A
LGTGRIFMGTEIKKGTHKSRGGLIRSFVSIEHGIIKEVTVSGDFFLFPEEAIFKLLEQLKGTPAKRDEIQKKIEEIYIETNIQSPGTSPADFTESIMKAIEG